VEYRIPELVQVQIHEKGLGGEAEKGLVYIPLNSITAGNPMEYRYCSRAWRACDQRFLLSIQLSIDSDIIRHREG